MCNQRMRSLLFLRCDQDAVTRVSFDVRPPSGSRAGLDLGVSFDPSTKKEVLTYPVRTLTYVLVRYYVSRH